MSDRYERYLGSDHWLKTRLNKLLTAELREAPPRVQCERCGLWMQFVATRNRRGLMAYGFAFHHKTYERIGAERLDDLEILCDGCHSAHHGYERPLWWHEAKQEEAKYGEFVVTKEFLRAHPKITTPRDMIIDKLVEVDRRLKQAGY